MANRGKAGFLIERIAAILLLAVILWAASRYSPPSPPVNDLSPLVDRIDALEFRQADQEQRLSTVEAAAEVCRTTPVSPIVMAMEDAE